MTKMFAVVALVITALPMVNMLRLPKFTKSNQDMHLKSEQRWEASLPILVGNVQREHRSKTDIFPNFKTELMVAGFNVATFLDTHGMPQWNSDVNKYLMLLMNNRQNTMRYPLPAVKQRPTPLELTANCNASGYFSGPRDKPARLVMILTLAYEIDLLETQLYELGDIVDEFVVYEGMYTQRGAPKPQIFEKAKERLANFLPKIRYYQQLPSEINFDPPERAVPEGGGKAAWMNENVRKFAYTRYVEEEENAQRSLDNVIFVNADIDEIPPAVGLHRFKHCKTEKLPASFCSNTYDPDFGHIHTHPDQCGKLGSGYWPFPSIFRKGEPMRAHFANKYDEEPGYHIHARDPWTFLAKLMSTAEAHGFPGITQKNADLLADPQALYEEYICYLKKEPASRKIEANRFDGEKRLPWFMVANEERFPYVNPDYVKCGPQP